MAQIDLDTCQLVGQKRKVLAGGSLGDWDDARKINEGSTLLKINGTYYSRICLDPMNFNPANGEFSASLSWTSQTIRYLPHHNTAHRAAGEILGSVLDYLRRGKPPE